MRQMRFVKNRLFSRILEEIDRSGEKIRLASATFEVTGILRLQIQCRDGAGIVDPKYVP